MKKLVLIINCDFEGWWYRPLIGKLWEVDTEYGTYTGGYLAIDTPHNREIYKQHKRQHMMDFNRLINGCYLIGEDVAENIGCNKDALFMLKKDG